MRRPLAVLTAAIVSALVTLVPVAAVHAATTSPAGTATPASSDTPTPTATPTPTPAASGTPAPTRPVLPVPPRVARPNVPKTTALWVDGTLRIVTAYGGPFYQGSSDSYTEVRVDGRVVATPGDARARDVLVSVARRVSAGPALVEVVTLDQIERGSYYDVHPTTFFSAKVTRHVVTPKKGQVSAARLLDRLRVAKEHHAHSYRSARFRRWVDANRDGENTRAEVLKAESSRKVAERGHAVVTGRWTSAYDGRTFTVASKLRIDHLVPLPEAWTSGASGWSTTKRTAYANDIGYAASLIAVSDHEYRTKSGKEPAAYLPSRTSARCAYVRGYIAVKSRWGLSVDSVERKALRVGLAKYCISPYVSKPGKPDLVALAGRPRPSTHPVSGGGSSGGGTTRGTDPRYATCTELHRHPNHAPYRRGVDAEYDWYMDRDHDGLVCE